MEYMEDSKNTFWLILKGESVFSSFVIELSKSLLLTHFHKDFLFIKKKTYSQIYPLFLQFFGVP